MKYIRSFTYSAGAILLLAALTRFLISTGDEPALSLPEPLLGIPIRYAIMAVGGLELVVALICLFGNRVGLQVGWLAWLTTNYFVYQIGLFTMQVHPQATCIGSLTDPLYLAGGSLGLIVSLLPVYLLMGSYAALVWLWLGSRGAQAAKFFKMCCPACGGHVRFDQRNLGQKIPCPHCKAVIALQRLEKLKMACYFCKEHIEFPAHAAGTKMPCPHCSMDITLKAA